MRISINEIKSLAEGILKKHGATNKEAELIAEEFLDGELRGKKHHGFALFKGFAVKLLKRKKGAPIIKKDEDCFMLIDGNGCLGQIVCKDILNKTIRKAKKKGIAITGIYNMSSYLMPDWPHRKMLLHSSLIMVDGEE